MKLTLLFLLLLVVVLGYEHCDRKSEVMNSHELYTKAAGYTNSQNKALTDKQALAKLIIDLTSYLKFDNSAV